ncbi:MAG: translocation/assembly module TamB domain-containing protein [Candidatus Krumholzibacteriia bacterium]
MTRRPPFQLSPQARRRVRRGARALGWGAAVAILALLLAAALPGPRGRALRWAIDRAGRTLPGTLTVGDARWPHLDRLVLHDLTWLAGDTLLARVDTLQVDVGLSALLARDLAVDRLEVAGITADVPAIQRHLPGGGGERTAGSSPAFPRPGNLPPWPSLLLADLQLRRATLTLADARTVDLDRVSGAIDLRRGQRARLVLAVDARPLADLGLAWRLDGGEAGDSLVLRIAPLVLARPDRLPPAASLAVAGRLSVPLSELRRLAAGEAGWPQLVLADLPIDGDLGHGLLDATLAGRRPGHARLRATWPVLPDLLGDALAAARPGLAVGWLDSLAGRWSDGGPPTLDLHLTLVPPDLPLPPTRGRVQVRGQVQLPGPAAVSPLLPPQLRVGDLGPLRAHVDAAYDGTGAVPGGRLRLDLDQTDWLDTALIVLHGDTSAATLDTLLVRRPDVAFSAHGRYDRRGVDLTADLVLPDASLLERWNDPALQGLQARGEVHATAHGPLPRPRLDVDLDAALTLARARLQIPDLRAHAALTADSLLASLDLPVGLTVDTLVITRLEADVAGRVPADLDAAQARIRLSVARRDLAGEVRGLLDVRGLDARPRGVLQLAGLTLRRGQETLASTAPCSLRWDLADTTVALSPLALTSDHGRVELAGTLAGQRLAARLATDLACDLDLLRPWLPEPALAYLPEHATVSLSGRSTAGGTLTMPHVAGDLTVGLTDQAGPAAYDLAADLQFSVASRRPWPQLDLVADVSARSPLFSVPRLEAAVSAGPDTVSVRVQVPDGGSFGQRRVTALAAAVDGRVAGDRERARGRVRLRAELPEAGLDLAGFLQARGLPGQPAGTLQLDSLALRLADLRLRSTAPCTLTASAVDSTISLSPLALVGSLGTFDLSASASPDSLAADLAMNLKLVLDALRPLLPTDAQAYLPNAGTLTLAGRADASGPLLDPRLQSSLRIGFLDQPDLGPLALTADLDVTRNTRAEIALLGDGTALARISARGPRPLPHAPADTLDARLLADGLDLVRLGPLLPAGVSLTGRLAADPRVTGILDVADPAPDLAMSGGLTVDEARVGLPDGSWAAVNGSLALSGTTREPVVRGGLRIEGGLIRVPEPPPTLLPVRGEAMLWSSEPADAAGAANGAASGSGPAGGGLDGILPDLEFGLTAPGGLWLRGQGLDVELAGDLTLRLRDGAPLLDGQLTALGGTLRQLGQVFTLQRGRVTFYADEGALDPELDLTLSVTVAGNQIKIVIGGTANAPQLSLQSEPEQSDGDIMALLLFGRTVDELDDGQSGLLTQRARQLAAAYGSQTIQDNVARQLGVDVLSILPAAGPDEASSLTVGKYLNPKVLVRYEQLLSAESAFFVHLDYSFWRDVKLHSQVSQGDASGLELKWEVDW